MILMLIHIWGPTAFELKLNKWRRFFESLICIPFMFIPGGILIPWLILHLISDKAWKESGRIKPKRNYLGGFKDDGIRFTKESLSEIKK